MRLLVFKRCVLAVLLLFVFDVSHLFSETGGLKDRPVSVALVCEPSSKTDKIRYYKSTSLFFKRLKAKRSQENGAAFFVGYATFASEVPTEQLARATENGYDLYIFSKEAKENLPTENVAGRIPWISFVVEKKIEPPKTQKKSSLKKASKTSKSKKKKDVVQKTSNGKKNKTSKNSKNSKIESKSEPQKPKEEISKTILFGNASFELSFDSLKFWFSTNTELQGIPFEPDRISFLAGEKTAEEWASLLEGKTENSTWIRLLSQPQDLRFNEGIYYTGCASPSIPNGISVLNFFFRGNRLIRLKQESFSLNSDGSGKSWDLE
ncbi:hypothetical protein A0128_10185 [Leptospira tipperaryensis]|uniref:Uncharacterized protein n=1 Tax=Leptospira tipperaryensis TaxID=2564040 RepID=A0A1D7UX67_9LEPT|nr:hypothetical protein [Leptospira tipperaryensis]AOP34182.1 hypothetical protein A0128_10185 [Leptospira tipperaryensis]